jgi:CubicO group peptidase (beta-lactamase class C family)
MKKKRHESNGTCKGSLIRPCRRQRPESIRKTCLIQNYCASLVTLFIAAVHFTAPFSANGDYFYKRADSYLSDLSNQDAFSGAVLVASNGVVAFEKCYGFLDRERRLPANVNASFAIGSITKQFIAMAVLILQEEHRINVTNHITEFIEGCPTEWSKVTIYHLINHTSGMPFLPFEMTTNYLKPAELIVQLKKQPLEFLPGACFKYSNSGYLLLGHIIETVSGQSYERFLSEHIFQPLSMRQTSIASSESHDQAVGYVKSENGPLPTRFPSGLLGAAGSVTSTVEDMLKWDNALYTEQLIPAKRLNLMFSPSTFQYCYGWRMLYGLNGDRIFMHSGSVPGFVSCALRIPSRRLYVLVLGNCEWGSADRLAADLACMFFESD